MSKRYNCVVCGINPNKNYEGNHYCLYHFWKKYPDRVSNQEWVAYRYSHPVRISRWRKADKQFDDLFKSLQPEIEEDRKRRRSMDSTRIR